MESDGIPVKREACAPDRVLTQEVSAGSEQTKGPTSLKVDPEAPPKEHVVVPLLSLRGNTSPKVELNGMFPPLDVSSPLDRNSKVLEVQVDSPSVHIVPIMSDYSTDGSLPSFLKTPSPRLELAMSKSEPFQTPPHNLEVPLSRSEGASVTPRLVASEGKERQAVRRRAMSLSILNPTPDTLQRTLHMLRYENIALRKQLEKQRFQMHKHEAAEEVQSPVAVVVHAHQHGASVELSVGGVTVASPAPQPVQEQQVSLEDVQFDLESGELDEGKEETKAPDTEEFDVGVAMAMMAGDVKVVSKAARVAAHRPRLVTQTQQTRNYSVSVLSAAEKQAAREEVRRRSQVVRPSSPAIVAVRPKALSMAVRDPILLEKERESAHRRFHIRRMSFPPRGAKNWDPRLRDEFSAARRHGVKMRKLNKVVNRQHKFFELSYCMMLGIRTTVSYLSSKMEFPHLRKEMRRLRASDFSAMSTLRMPAEGTSLTPAHSMRDFKFKDYMPKVFHLLRDLHGIDPGDYINDVCGNFQYLEFISNSKSGSFFFFSHGRKYMIKTITKTEGKFLRKILRQYYAHMHRYPHSLLTRFYGLHRVKIHKKKKVRFLIMGSVFDTPNRIHTAFDLKGSTYGRVASAKERKSLVPILKDQDLLNMGVKIKLGEQRAQLLRLQLKWDVGLLRELGIMDFSLLLGIHNKQPPHISPRSQSVRTRAPGLGRVGSVPNNDVLEALRNNPSLLKHRRSFTVGSMDEVSRTFIEQVSSLSANSKASSNSKPNGHERPRSADMSLKRGSSSELKAPPEPERDSAVDLTTQLAAEDMKSFSSPKRRHHDPPSEETIFHDSRVRAGSLSGSVPVLSRKVSPPFRLSPSMITINPHKTKQQEDMSPRSIAATIFRHNKDYFIPRKYNCLSSPDLALFKAPEFGPLPSLLRRQMEKKLATVDEKEDEKEDESDSEGEVLHIPSVFDRDEGGIGGVSEEVFYLGIIDILQEYNAKKKAEHFIKSRLHNKDEISAVPPRQYAERFLHFMDKIIE